MTSSRADDRYRQRQPSRRVVVVDGDRSRSFTVRPWLMGALAILGTAVSVAYVGATAYLVFRDDLINTAFSRNADLQQAYEDRIAALRSEIDKIASRQLLDQVAFDEKVERLLAAQRAIDDRAEAVTGLIERARASGLLDDAPGTEKEASADPVVTGTTTAYADAGNAAEIESRFAALTGLPAVGDAGVPASLDALPLDAEGKPDLRHMALRLDHIDEQQTAVVQAIADAAEDRAEQVTGIIGDLGIRLKLATTDPTASDPAGDQTAVGGPFIPLQSAESLGAAMAEADAAFSQLNRLKTVVGRLPLAAPIPNASMTSNFGSRSDPFLGSAAFHAGIDFRSPSGKPVHATAAGTVTEAGRHGGYGNLVEIDHGKGLTTRYAHLSRIDVKAGDKVAPGDVIGRVGSTGRSTGPHLHYETRVNGSPVNPATYMSAGRRIAGILR